MTFKTDTLSSEEAQVAMEFLLILVTVTILVLFGGKFFTAVRESLAGHRQAAVQHITAPPGD